jgi:hypothetical protein
MISFYLLAYFFKSFLIKVVTSVNYYKRTFDIVGTAPYEQLKDEMVLYKEHLIEKKLPDEVMQLHENLGDFLWTVEFL